MKLFALAILVLCTRGAAVLYDNYSNAEGTACLTPWDLRNESEVSRLPPEGAPLMSWGAYYGRFNMVWGTGGP
jgi:hypothetical protein